MSLQGFVNLRMVMVRAEYPKVYRYLHKELQKHLKRLAFEGRMIFQQLSSNITRMVHIGKLLRSIYEELRELCCKADVDLLQVRTGEGWLRSAHQLAGKSVLSTDISSLVDLHYSSDS